MGFLLKNRHCRQVPLSYLLLKIIKEMKKETGWRNFELKVKKKIVNSSTLNEPTEEDTLITPCYFAMPVEGNKSFKWTYIGWTCINKTGAMTLLHIENCFALTLELLRSITLRKFASNWLATALASNVFPVPEKERYKKLPNKFISLNCQSWELRDFLYHDPERRIGKISLYVCKIFPHLPLS